MDGFIVLSGFLASFPLKSKSMPFSFKRYIGGRCRKILLPYAVVLLLTYFGIPHGKSIPVKMQANHDVMFGYCPQTLPLSLLLLNNFVGFGGCSLHLWSVSVQMHLFLLYALTIRIMSRKTKQGISGVTKLAGVAFALCSLGRVAIGVLYQIDMPVPAFSHPDLDAKSMYDAFRYYHTMYFLTPLRLCNFTAGMLLASVVQPPQQKRTTRTQLLGVPLVTIIMIYAYLNLVGSIEYSQKALETWKFSPAWASLVFHGSPGSSLLFSLILYCFIVVGRCCEWTYDFKVYRIVIQSLSRVRHSRMYLMSAFTASNSHHSRDDIIVFSILLLRYDSDIVSAGFVLDIPHPSFHSILGSSYA